jgi:membrane protein DedA with SNARE-associated domain
MTWWQVLLAYLSVLSGVILEGETVVITAAFSADRGYLNIYIVFLMAVLGTIISDYFWFFLGRLRGRWFLMKKPKWQQKIAKADQLLQRYQTLILIGYRFLYGFRIILPLVIGLSRVKTRVFLAYSLGVIIFWSILVCTIGFYFGEFLGAHFNRLKEYEFSIILGILLVGISIRLGLLAYKKIRYRKPVLD